MPNDSNTTNGETKKNKPEEMSSSQTSAADSVSKNLILILTH